MQFDTTSLAVKGLRLLTDNYYNDGEYRDWIPMALCCSTGLNQVAVMPTIVSLMSPTYSPSSPSLHPAAFPNP